VTDIAGLITASVALAVAAGGYIQFVLPRSIFPCIDFEVDLVAMSQSAPGHLSVGEVVLLVKNVGPGVGSVANVQCRVRYRRVGESGLGPDSLEPSFARSVAAGRRRAAPSGRAEDRRSADGEGFTRILKGDVFALVPNSPGNFIQPGVTQRYRKPLAFPADTDLVHIWGAFEYNIKVGGSRGS
jgi:hypothetical protein